MNFKLLHLLSKWEAKNNDFLIEHELLEESEPSLLLLHQKPGLERAHTPPVHVALARLRIEDRKKKKKEAQHVRKAGAACADAHGSADTDTHAEVHTHSDRHTHTHALSQTLAPLSPSFYRLAVHATQTRTARKLGSSACVIAGRGKNRVAAVQGESSLARTASSLIRSLTARVWIWGWRKQWRAGV